MLSFNDWLSSGERGGFRFKLDVQISMDVAGQGGVVVLKIGQLLWKSYVYRP